MEQVDRHGAGSDIGIEGLLLGDQKRDGKCQEETDQIAEHTAEDSLGCRLPQVVIIVAPVEDLGRQRLMRRFKDQEQDEAEDTRTCKDLVLPGTHPADHRTVKPHSGEEEREIYQCPGNAQEVAWHVHAADQKPGDDGQNQISWDSHNERRQKPPDKEG